MKTITMEICANSFESAVNAEKGGADRIELCSELAVGGITPSYGLIKKTVEEIAIPIHILIRPRSGNFTYSDTEFDIMKRDIVFCKSIGCTGIVSGVLHEDHTLDVKRTEELIELASPLSFTFHRAFDWIPNPEKTIRILEEIGTDRVLTSGQQVKALDGINLLVKLRDKVSKLKILPGGGINADNAKVFKDNNFEEIHLSVISIVKSGTPVKLSMNNLKMVDDDLTMFSDLQKIQKIKEAIK
ncbi:copper homeostasis protein CutC [uncultured Aquimarina sp.]|uniref:copper homeostasis protein CutC n=1 Tax=uncultured Aquimarina sp. TaxID=575652 RepID=UPI003422CC18